MALILTRRIGERIQIDGPSVIELHDVRGCQASLAIAADKTTRIVRQEILPMAQRVDYSKRTNVESAIADLASAPLSEFMGDRAG